MERTRCRPAGSEACWAYTLTDWSLRTPVLALNAAGVARLADTYTLTDWSLRMALALNAAWAGRLRDITLSLT